MIRTLLFATLLSAAALADAPSAAITGAITDPSGLPVTAAAITALNLETGVSRATLTNEAGVYRIVGLQTGAYSLTATRDQFAPVRQDGIVLRVGETIRIDLALPLGSAHDAVSVTEAAAQAGAESATSSTIVNREAVQDLPGDGRQLQNLALIVPGVSAGWNLSTAANRYGKARENTEGAFSVNGARSRSNSFLVDGMPMNLRQYSVINFEPSNESVEEFSVIASVPAPEYGRTMGGQLSIVTRAGSARFHASAYEFFRNNALNANDTLSKRSGLPRGVVRHHQFGGTLGGPIWKDRHFFFASAELLRNLEASETRTVTVPTADERNGLIHYTDPSGAARTLALTPTPIGAKLASLYPLPNASLPQGNYTAPLAIGLHDFQYAVRTDHHFTPRDIATLRIAWNLNDQTYIIDRFGGPYIPGFPLPNPERTTNGALGYLKTLSPAVVNEARLGVNRYGNILANGDPRNAAEFGLPNGSPANGIPSIVFAQGGLTGLGGLSWYNREQDELTVFASDTVSVLKGSHSLKFGAEASRYHFNTRGASDQRGSLYFDGSRNTLIPKTLANANANALADLLLGLPYQATITVGQFGRGYRQWAFAAFAQDQWRATRRLSIHYGLRYDYNAPWTEVNGKLSNFIPSQGVVSNLARLYTASALNLGPRAGFAYDLTGRQTTVLRGGFGILFETLLQASTVQQIENNPPYSASAVTTTPAPFPQSASPATTLLDLRASAQPSNSLAAVPSRLPTPYNMQSFFELERAIARDWTLTLGYHGARGVHLPFNYNINQVPLDTLTAAQISIGNPPRPYPAFNSISLFANDATSTYHSLQTRLERRFRAGFNLLAAYTWSKSIDTASDFGSGDPSESILDSRRLDLQKGLSSFDVPHRFTAAFNYLIPAPRFRALLGGWQANGLITWQSGQPFTPYTSAFDPYRNESFNRLNVVGDPNRNVPAGLAYNPSAFTLPAPGTFGTSGRNIVRGDGYRSADLSLFRNFTLRESLKLQLRAEASNALNQVNFQGPVTNQSTTPGAFVAAAPPRTIQLGARLSF